MKRHQLQTFIILMLFTLPTQADWKVDFSRRTKEIKQRDHVTPEGQQEKESMFDFIFSSAEPIQDVVILNTDRGFVPATLRAREGAQYRIHIVNVNEKDKNVSFVMDSFSEHHATYYGQIKTFIIRPKKEGVYTFQSPETSAQGRLVVYPQKSSGEVTELRAPASE